MPFLAYFGIESGGLNLVIDLLILFVVVLYVALIYWTYSDARRRMEDPIMIGFAAVVALLFPFLGAIIYLILRPPEYLEDVRERELEIQAAEARLHDAGHNLCPHCSYPTERDFLRCPSCLRKLKDNCASCSRPLDPAWTICPYCEAEVMSPPPARRMAQRRSAGKLEPERPKLRGTAPSSAAARAAEATGAGERPTKPAAPARSAAPAEDEARPARLAAPEPVRATRSGRAASSRRPRPSS